ncbi:hypothetical protein C5C07_19740 [Haloferax sp. Atlit-4N]|uniref:DUF6884 domain-containing protein n=1 Tax=Haloferax sp. Atlit-4N TaxID=2077206 RepID=UPI000E258EC0|nr:DUF6884 domain-containing protein [Haloferax sp. Atlit-4N]RDZ49998.1 hypothetical protein C5C07_19740 [Haloferax sp. Atlit-4N]
MPDIGLVSCTKNKRESPAKPRDLYDTSNLFVKVRSYCETHHDDWFILSAKHHLLDPDDSEIEPYDESLTDAAVDARREWSVVVYRQLRDKGLTDSGTTLVIHAGKKYYEELLPYLSDEACDVEIPTEGLQIGDTLSWYTTNQ